MQHETRWLPAETAGVRMVSQGGLEYLVGYAAVFDSLSEDLGGFREKIAPGSFRRAIAEGQDVVLVPDHSREAAKVLGRLRSGTLSLEETFKGLLVRAELPATQEGRDIREVIRRGDVSGMSFAFSLPNSKAERWERSGDIVTRTILDVNLHDVSVVVDPAYRQTSVQVSTRARATALLHRLEPAADDTYRYRLQLADASGKRAPILTPSVPNDCGPAGRV